MKKIISVCSEKGGVGKTTTTLKIASELAKDGFKVLVVDLDQQGNASRFLSGTNEEEKRSSTDLIFDTVSGRKIDGDMFVSYNEQSNIYYIVSNELLSSVVNFMMQSPDPNQILRTVFASDYFDRFDFIIFDCRTVLDVLVSNALNTSDYVIIPVECAVYSFDGLPKMIDKVESIKSTSNPKLRLLGILLNKNTNTNISKGVISKIREEYENETFYTVVPLCPAQAEESILINRKAGTMDFAFRNISKEILFRIKKDDGIFDSSTISNEISDTDNSFDSNDEVNEENVVVIENEEDTESSDDDADNKDDNDSRDCYW